MVGIGHKSLSFFLIDRDSCRRHIHGFEGGAGGKNTRFIAVLTKGPSDGALEKVWILFIVAINSMTKKVTYRFCVPRLDG